jgi:hypothetical protein
MRFSRCARVGTARTGAVTQQQAYGVTVTRDLDRDGGGVERSMMRRRLQTL